MFPMGQRRAALVPPPQPKLSIEGSVPGATGTGLVGRFQYFPKAASGPAFWIEGVERRATHPRQEALAKSTPNSRDGAE